jgi:hypothetical protein
VIPVAGTGLVLTPAVLAVIGTAVSVITDLLDDPKKKLREGTKVLLLVLLAFGATVLTEAAGQPGGVDFNRAFWSRFVLVLAAAFLSHYGITVPSGLSKAIQDHVSIPVLSSVTSTVMRGVSPQIVAPVETVEAEAQPVPLDVPLATGTTTTAAGSTTTVTGPLAGTTYVPSGQNALTNEPATQPVPTVEAPTEPVQIHYTAAPDATDAASAVSPTIDLDQAPGAAE